MRFSFFQNKDFLHNRGFSTQRITTRLPIGKVLLVVIGAVVVLGIIFWGKSLTGGTTPPIVGENRAQLTPPKSTQSITREFSFPLRDQKGEEVSKVKFVIENAESRNQIIVKGQRATAVRGKIFLILNIKITNEYNKSIEIKTRDYLRLQVNDNEKELLAPDIHNDPVEVLASSTKTTRVGFTLNEFDKNLKLRVGEIDKEKTIIDITVNK